MFRIDNHLFRMVFDSYGDDRWSMGWIPLTEVPPRSGLFPRAASQFKQHIVDFIERQQPESLGFAGGDIKRSTFYATSCPELTPEGYTCEIEWKGWFDAQGRDRGAEVVFRRVEPTAKLNPRQ